MQRQAAAPHYQKYQYYGELLMRYEAFADSIIQGELLQVKLAQFDVTEIID